MTVREKLLLAFMGLALAGGGVQFALNMLPAAAPQDEAEALQRARAVSGDVSAALQGLAISEGQRYILATALRPASGNPFTLPEVLAGSQHSVQDTSGLVYSGYVRVGNAALAIIGGLEYGVGDALPNTGDVIRAIRADGVTLYSPSRDTEWTLPYAGDDL